MTILRSCQTAWEAVTAVKDKRFLQAEVWRNEGFDKKEGREWDPKEANRS